MDETIFDKVMSGEIESYPVWEDEKFFAFLTPFPNTPGLTIVIPKVNPGDYVFSLEDQLYTEFMLASKKVANLLERALDVGRVAMVFEGTGVAHVHAKLYPLYGELASQTNVWAGEKDFVEEYRGYITTLEGPKMNSEQLEEIQNKIRFVVE